jgi:hypothetical protein
VRDHAGRAHPAGREVRGRGRATGTRPGGTRPRKMSLLLAKGRQRVRHERAASALTSKRNDDSSRGTSVAPAMPTTIPRDTSVSTVNEDVRVHA